MFNESRIDIYDYLRSVLGENVTKNIYDMYVPQELTKSDVNDGFIVINVGNLNDQSEFAKNAYGWVRCHLQAFVPTMTRGKVNRSKYEEFESGINECISTAVSANQSDVYQISEDSILSMNGVEISNANNIFFTFIKSFIVYILCDPYAT